MAIFIVVLILLLLLFSRIAFIRQSQDETIRQLENMLGAKARITKARFWYAHSFTIIGFYKGKEVILSVIYGDRWRLRHQELMEVRASIKLNDEQIKKYGTGRGKINFFEGIKNIILRAPSSRIHCGCLEMWCIYFIFPPTFEEINRIIEEGVKRAEKI